ncbi:MAG: hypothetical protein QXO24_02710 [Candidatus Micrarchaeaceae archaeon]
MNFEILAAVIGIIGVLVGSVAQYVFTRAQESVKHYRELRSQAYTDFIKAVAGIAISQKSDSRNREIEFLSLLADAKSRIAVYGSKQVVESMADFFVHHSALDSPEALAAFATIVQKMRRDTVMKGEEVLDEHIRALLFGAK